jgi:hypothetical protein
MKAAVRAWNTEKDFFKEDCLRIQDEFKGDGFDKQGGYKISIGGQKGRVVRVPGRALAAMDAFFKYATGQMEVGAQAYRLGKAQGLEGKKLEDFITSEVNNYGSSSWHLAVAKANDLTFQTDISKEGVGWYVRKIGEMRGAKPKTPGGKMLKIFMGMIFPFIKTPYNIFRIGLRKTPVIGTVNVVKHVVQGFYSIRNGKMFVDGYSKQQMVTDLAEQAIAWATLVLLWGAIEGDGDDDDKKLLLITGSRPGKVEQSGERDVLNRMYGGQYQIRIGGRNGATLDYGRIEPFATILGTVADGVRLAKSKDRSEVIPKLFSYLTAQAQGKTFLQGFSSVTQLLGTALRDPKDIGNEFKRMFLSGLVPNLIRQPLRNLDDYARDSKYAGIDYTLTAAPGTAEKRFDLYGEEVKKSGYSISRILFAEGTEPTAEIKNGDRFLMNWNRKNKDAKPYWPERPSSATYRLKRKDNSVVEMTPQQIAEFDKLAGKAFSKRLAGWLTRTRATYPLPGDLKRFQNDLQEARAEAKRFIALRANLVASDVDAE